MAKKRKICLFGCAPTTHNLGVSALFISAMAGIARRDPDAQVSVFDFGRGVTEATLQLGGQPFRYQRVGANNSKRYHAQDSFWNIRISARLGGLGNPAARLIRQADLAFDLSAGDSFTDLYGPKRFQTIMMPKWIAIDQGVPLILLPQTYGPFDTAAGQSAARRALGSVQTAWARDANSYAAMQALLGASFDASRHRCGVDLAFALPAEEPSQPLPEAMVQWLGQARETDVPVVGFNVSGLIYNGGESAKRQYNLRADYRQVVHQFLDRLLKESKAQVVLVPHVLDPVGDIESDMQACETVAHALGAQAEGRVAVLPRIPDPRQIKAVIRRFNWFCGTRMHSTIAALSSGVPTAAIAYSIKTQGVFETCGQGDHVIDPMRSDTQASVEGLWSAWLSRDEARQSLAQALPSVLDQAQSQMDQFMELGVGRVSA